MKEAYFKQPSVTSAQQHFAASPVAEIERSTFDRSHAHKTTMDEGYLVPIYVDEVLPGDTFSMTQTLFARLATPLKPFMDNVFMDVHYFFVPYRLVWDNWQRFMGERDAPDDDPSTLTVPVYPCIMDNVQSGTLMNYMGVPIPNTEAAGKTVNVAALPFRAYWLIYNEWYRDQNLCDPVIIDKGDGPDTALAFLTAPGLRGKRHDYFTSALPWPQKGDPVVIPVGPIVSNGEIVQGKWATGTSANMQLASGTGLMQISGTANSAIEPFYFGTETGLAVETNPDFGAATINDLRVAFQVQKLLERDARGGTRYIELILAHFGVKSDDARLQRPEFLGGSTARVNVSPVASTFRNQDVAQGDLAGFGTVLNRAGWTKSFTEHGVVLGIASVRADLTYQNGLERFWKRLTRFDYYWPAFAHLGEQMVANSEIYLSGSDIPDGLPWGYQERYAEYRYKPSRISGKFSSNDPQSLDVWHLAQDFTALPVLNESFIKAPPPIARVVAVPDEPHFLLDVWFQLRCQRPMPVYSVPGLVDHF